MGFFDSFFDKREKTDYYKACDYLFNIGLVLKTGYDVEFSDVSELDYRADIVSIIITYLNTLPKEKCVPSYTTLGEEAMHYGTVHGTVLIDTHPIQANLKNKFLPAVKEKHKYYSKFVKDRMNNSINANSARILASEILRLNGVPEDATRVNAIAMDILAMTGHVDAFLSKFRLVK